MSKKHFIELAALMKRNKSFISPTAFERICNDLAAFCAKSNPNFNRGKFLEACGL